MICIVQKILRAIRQPGFYARRTGQIILLRLTSLFARRSFFLQSRMDIDPSSFWHNPKFIASSGGFTPKGEAVARTIVETAPWDLVRRDMLVLLIRGIIERGIEGSFAELGVYKGETARLIHHYAPERRLRLFDTFSGFDARDLSEEQAQTGQAVTDGVFEDTSLETVQAYVSPRSDAIIFHKGLFPETCDEAVLAERFAFVHLDADLYQPILAGLEIFYPRLSPGGVLVIHDYNAWEGARRAVDEYFADKPEVPVAMPDKSGSAVVIKARA
jgi:O-methyltransferase